MGMSTEDIMKKYKMSSVSPVRGILTGNLYPNAGGPFGQKDNCKVGDEDVIRMREMRAAGSSLFDIATLFDISISNTSRVVRGKTRKGAGGPLVSNMHVGPLHFSEDDIIRMREMRAAGVTLIALGELFGCSRETVRQITCGKGYTYLGGPITIGKKYTGTPSRPRTGRPQAKRKRRPKKSYEHIKDEDIILIREWRAAGAEISRLVQIFNLNYRTIKGITEGRIRIQVDGPITTRKLTFADKVQLMLDRDPSDPALGYMRGGQDFLKTPS